MKNVTRTFQEKVCDSLNETMMSSTLVINDPANLPLEILLLHLIPFYVSIRHKIMKEVSLGQQNKKHYVQSTESHKQYVSVVNSDKLLERRL